MARSVILAVLALLSAAPAAVAQPPTEPAPPPLPAHPLAPLAQSGSPVGLAGLPPQLIGPGGEFILGQHAVPSAPGAAPATPPHLNAWNNQYLLPQNLEPSAPGEGTVFGVEPGQENADIRGIDYARRLWEMYRTGGLDGGLLGQRPVESLNKPLPEPSASAPAPGA